MPYRNTSSTMVLTLIIIFSFTVLRIADPEKIIQAALLNQKNNDEYS